MKQTLTRAIRKFGHQTSFFFFFFVLSLGVYTLTQYQRSLSWVEHSYEVVTEIQKVATYFERAETSQRGFLITGNEEYIDAFHATVSDMQKTSEMLTKLVEDNSRQKENAQSISNLITQRLERMHERIAEKRSGSFNLVSNQLSASGAGNELSKKLRHTLQDMENDEVEILRERQDLLKSVTRKSLGLALLGAIFGMALAISSRRISRKERDDNFHQAKLMDLIIESMTDGLVMINRRGEFTVANKAAQALIGTEFKNVNPDERAASFGMHNPTDKKLFNSSELPLARAMKGETISEMEVYIKNKWVPEGVMTSISGIPLQDSEGAIVGAIAVFRDISKRKQMEEDWSSARHSSIEASKLKSEFLATISHEIRTPMNGILGMSSLLSDTKLSSEQFEYVGLIRKSAQALLTSINDILDLSKVEAGKLTLDPLDFAVLTQLQKHSKPGEDLVELLLVEYRQSFPPALTSLKKSFENKELSELSDTAHGLKSVSASLGMSRVVQICEALEEAEALTPQTLNQIHELQYEIETALSLLTERRPSQV